MELYITIVIAIAVLALAVYLAIKHLIGAYISSILSTYTKVFNMFSKIASLFKKKK